MQRIKRLVSLVIATIMFVASIPMFMLPVSAASALKIPSGAKFYGGHMYYIYKSNINWESAKKACEKRGGHLVTITSKKENDFVKDLIKNKNDVYVCWIGTYNKAPERNTDSWTLVNNENFIYKNWAYGTFQSYTDDYAYISGEDGLWGASRYGVRDGYVCEWEVGKTTGIKQVASTSSSVTISWKDNRYATKYIIYYYDTYSKKYIKYKTVTKTSITIDGLSSATTHKIGISTVIKNNGKSQTLSKSVFNAVTTPGKTKNLKIEDKISLTWTKVKGADGYVVYKYDPDVKKWETFDTVKKNSCKIGKKIGKAKQQYKVRAFKKSTDGKKFYGGYSNIVKR